MNNSTSDIMQAFFNALSSGDQTKISQFLWEDFKEITNRLETYDKQAYLQSIDKQIGQQKILDMQVVGNVVKVEHTLNGAEKAQHRIFALVDNKIKLGVQL